MLEIRSEQMERAYELLQSCSKADVAIHNAAKRAVQTARGKVWEAVKKQYTVKRSAFYKQTSVDVMSKKGTEMYAGLSLKGFLIPLVEFQHENINPYLLVSVEKGVESQLRHAYEANLGTYGEAIFERLAPRRNSSSQLYGPSVAHMAQNAEVSDDIMTAVQETFDKRLEHEVDRILRGYGV